MFIPHLSEHTEDNPTPLSLLSLPGDVREALQLVIASGELDLDEINPDQVILPDIWIPVNAPEQIKKANSTTTAADQDEVMD